MSIETGTEVWKASFTIPTTTVGNKTLDKWSKTLQRVKEGVTDAQVFNMCAGFAKLTKYASSVPAALTVNKISTTPLTYSE